MGDEKSSSSPVVIEHNRKLQSGKQVADHILTNIQKVPEDRRKEVREAQNHFQDMGPEDDVMATPFTSQQLEEKIKLLKKENSPKPDGVTNELIQRLGPSAKQSLVKILNASWKKSSVSQSWRVLTMIIIHKNIKDRSKAESYRPKKLCWQTDGNADRHQTDVVPREAANHHNTASRLQTKLTTSILNPIQPCYASWGQ